MKNSLSISGFNDQFEQLMSQSRLAEAVNLICIAAQQTMTSGEFRGVCLRLPELDSGLVRIANLMRPEFAAAPAPRAEHTCLVTEVYVTGGHRTILNSVVEEIPSHVIFTDLFDGITAGKTKLRGLISAKALSSITLNSDDFIQKVRSAVHLLNALSPKRVWIFNHHQDAIVLLAALIFDGGRRSVFVHHCDHDPALGATIKFPVHLDLTEELLQNCASIGLEPLPLAIYTPSARQRVAHAGGDLVVASAGSFKKFNGSLRGMQYRDVVRVVLQHPRVTTFHHIGAVSEPYIAEFRAYLESSGLDPQRMKFAGEVPRVSDYVLSVGAQVYLSSFPLGAGATTAEVQSAGLPVIYFDPNQQEMPLCSIASVYASPQLEWRELSDIHPALDQVVEHWSLYSDAAQRKYAESSSREVFLKQLESLR
jgi:hypothetical protein